MNARLTQCVLAIALAALTLPARASVLTFDNMGIGSNNPVPQDYGDNISTLPGGAPNPNTSYTYGTAYGATPDITMAYAPATTPTLDFWGGAGTFGDLVNVLYNPDGTFYSITLTAENGDLVSLKSFDLAADTANATLNDLQVIVDGTPTDITPGDPVLHKWSDEPTDTVLTHTSFDLTTDNFTGTTMEILVDNSSGNIAIDNVAFAEITPEPASLGLLVVGSLLLLRRRPV